MLVKQSLSNLKKLNNLNDNQMKKVIITLPTFYGFTTLT
jgi:hypothetical protein